MKTPKTELERKKDMANVVKFPRPVKCSICGDPIQPKGSWTDGNNAWPVNDGRCCDDCDDTVVTPARFRRLGFVLRDDDNPNHGK